MLTSIDVKLIFNCLFLFSSANILQIADVVRRVTFLLVLAMFLAVKRVKCSAGYVLTAKITQPRAQVFSVNCLVFRQWYYRIDVIFRILQNSSKFPKPRLNNQTSQRNEPLVNNRKTHDI